MANNYFWDLGFDFGAVQKSNTLSYLRHGLVLDGAASFPQNFSNGDTIEFNVFNLTANASQDDGTTILRASFTLINASTGMAANPFNATLNPTTGPSTVLATSVIFSPQTSLPRWTLTNSTVGNSGNYLLTIALVVQGTNPSNVGTNNIRTFVIDPEMVVGSAGGGGQDEDLRGHKGNK